MHQKGEQDYDFPPVYFIGLMDFSFHEGSEQVLFRYRLREDVTGEVMSDRVNYLFLELPNCSRALTPAGTTLDKFCFALHNMWRLQEKPAGMEGELFSLLFDSAEFRNLAPKEQIKYRNDMTTARDIANQIDYARKEGMEKGMEKGLQQGIEKGVEQGQHQALKKVACNMLKRNIPVDEIAHITGLSEAEVRDLQQS